MTSCSASNHNSVISWLLSIYERRQLVFSLVESDNTAASDEVSELVSARPGGLQSIHNAECLDGTPSANGKAQLQSASRQTVECLEPLTTSTLNNNQRGQSRVKVVQNNKINDYSVA